MSESSEIVKSYHKKIKDDAENLVLTQIPDIITRINKSLEDFDLKTCGGCSGNETKTGDVVNEFEGLSVKNGNKVSINKKYSDLFGEIKPLLKQLIEHGELIKMWIILSIPKIEDGNNFGVEIQELIISSVNSTIQAAKANYNEGVSYYNSRAKLVSKVIKYPQIDDYKKFIQELDEAQMYNLYLVLKSIKNDYSALYDIVLKNLEKIKRPKPNQESESHCNDYYRSTLQIKTYDCSVQKTKSLNMSHKLEDAKNFSFTLQCAFEPVGTYPCNYQTSLRPMSDLVLHNDESSR